MSEVNAYKFDHIYQELGIDFSQLGCIMLDIDNTTIPAFKNRENLYEDENSSVASGNPHVTLLFGLLKSGEEYKTYIDELLEGWSCKYVVVDKVDFFDSPNPTKEPYYCIIAHMKVTPELQAGHDRLQMLPHVDTFPGYKAHMTIAYINRDEEVKTDVIDYYQNALAGKTFKVLGLNYGRRPVDVDKSMYCVSCKIKKEPKNPRPHQMKNGRQAHRGECPDCNTSMFRLGAMI